MNKFSINRLLISVVFIAIILILRDLFDVGFNQVFILGLIGCICILLPYDELFYFTSFIAPIASGINGYALTLLLIFLLYKSKRKSLQQFIPVVILIIVELLHPPIYSLPLSNELLYFTNIALFFFCSSDINNLDSRRVVKYFIFGTVLCCFLILGRTYLLTGNFESIFLDSARTGVTMGGDLSADNETHMALNANALAYISLLGFSCLLIGRKILSIPLSLYITSLCILLLGGIITLGRTWVIVTVLILLLYLFNLNIKQKISYVILSIALIFIVSQTDFIRSLFLVISSGFTERFTSADFAEAGGRMGLWKDYIQIWTSDISYVLLGISAPNYRLLFPDVNSIHNIIQQIFVCTGIVGLMVYLVFYFKLLLKSIRKRTKFILYLPIIAASLYLQSISVLANWILFLPLFPCIHALRLNMESDR